jgi:hypothetical protein
MAADLREDTVDTALRVSVGIARWCEAAAGVKEVAMCNWLARPWKLGSVSPLQMLRGMLDMSLQWRDSSLVGGARLVLFAVAIWGW